MTVKDTFKIAELRDAHVVEQITTTSTFYVPPRDAAPVSADHMQQLHFDEKAVRGRCLRRRLLRRARESGS